MTLIEKLSNSLLGLVWNLAFRPGYSPQKMRRNFDFISVLLRPTFFRSAKIERTRIGGVPAAIFHPANPSRTVILYLHGGGYFMGSIRAHTHDALTLTRLSNATVVLLDYRLAPEHPHPAALEDALVAYRALAQKFGAENLIVGGDSAGGGLTLALLMAVRDKGIPLPSRAFLVSPWTDLLGTGASVDVNAKRDVWLSRRHLEAWAPWYVSTSDPEHPYLSPLYGDFRGLPRLLFFVGDQEVLLDDTLVAAQKARDAGVMVEVCIGRNMQHDWLYAVPWLRESRRALAVLEIFFAPVNQ